MLSTWGPSAVCVGNKGLMCMECKSIEAPTSGCPLTPGPTQGGIGAAHRPYEKPRRGIGASRSVKSKPRSYEGLPRAPGGNRREHLDAP